MHTQHSNSLASVAEQLQRVDATKNIPEDHKKLYHLLYVAGKCLLEAAYLAVASGKSKTVTADHLKMIAKLEEFFLTKGRISSSSSKGGGQAKKRGGAVRLPSEYFGINSGRYAEEVPQGHQPWSTSQTRTALYASNPPFKINMVPGGGSKSGALSDELLADIIKKCNSDKGKGEFELRVSKEALPLLSKLILHNLVYCLKNKGQKLSAISEKDIKQNVSFSYVL
jgi:hypothetical protein